MAMISILLCLIGAIFLVTLILIAFSIRIVPNNMHLTVYRLGEYLGDKGPGLVILIPFVDRGVMKQLDVTDQPVDGKN